VAGGYSAPKGDSLDPIVSAIKEARRQARDLARPQGTNLTGLVSQVQALLQQVQDALVNIQTTVETDTDNYLSAGTVAMGSINASGNVSAVNVTATGQVSSAQAFKSPGSHDYIVSTNYVAGWINGDGTIGTSPSTKDVKKDLQAMAPQDVFDRLNTLTAYWGRYDWDDETEPLKVFLLAEDVKAAGFGPDVAPVVPGDQPVNVGTDEYPAWVQPGDAYTVNYSQLIVPMIAAGQAMQAEIEQNQADIATLKAQVAALTPTP